jgi:hypothetical protein
MLNPYKNLVKFGLLVALSAIFIDAAIAHGLFWDNDPYWTYWITKTFLIATVFILGSALIGIGMWQGFALTAVHTAILEIYYQWLAPVGLPQEPEWLDFNHLWVTGVPVHFLAILAGYFLALWLWHRNKVEATMLAETSGFAIFALVVVSSVILLDGIITQLILLGDFPGLTFFVQHLLIGFVFTAVWTAYAGARDVFQWTVGALLLALVWTTYSMYLGPRGLPFDPPTYSGYDDLWWKAFPGALISALVGWWGCDRLLRDRFIVPIASVIVIVGFFITAPVFAQTLPVEKGTNAMYAAAQSAGEGVRVVGPDPVNMSSTQPISGKIKVETWEMGNRWSHIQNTDPTSVIATFTSEGANYEITIDKPMPRHPLGRYTTWSGVVYGHDMHGNTGIGTGKLPKMRPDIALWGWAEVKKDGKTIVRMAPAHVMVTTKGAMPGIMLEVDTEDKALVEEPDGYIHVVWQKVDTIQLPSAAMYKRTVAGWVGLLALTLLFGFLAAMSRAPATMIRAKKG